MLRPDASLYRPEAAYVRELLQRANLSQRAAAKQLGINDRTMRYYVSGENDMPYSLQFCLEVLAHQVAN